MVKHRAESSKILISLSDNFTFSFFFQVLDFKLNFHKVFYPCFNIVIFPADLLEESDAKHIALCTLPFFVNRKRG